MPIDPLHNAVRRDLADIALADRVFAQHYVVPLPHKSTRKVALRSQPRQDSEQVAMIQTGATFHVLDIGNEWAWGRTETDSMVGYVEASALTAA